MEVIKYQLLVGEKMYLETERGGGGKIAILWIGYRMAYHWILYSWIIECMNIFHIASHVE